MTKKGLTTKQAEDKLRQVGLNTIQEGKKKSTVEIFIQQFQNFFILLLIFATVLSLLLGEFIEGILILVIIILNALFGLYQEKKAEQAISALKKMTSTHVRVMRDGKEVSIESVYVVPGDIVFIEEGNKIPADGMVLESLNMEINEAALTGESYPVSKKEQDDLFAGTIVTKGRGKVEITKTGMQTEFGKIAEQISHIEETKTPLQKKMAQISRVVGIFGVVSSFLVFVLSYFLTGEGLFPSMLLAVSLAVAVVPEGLPAVMTITLAMGVKNMALRKAIMRNLSAIEALGNVTLIASDKTGTLTTNVMQVKEVWTNKAVFKEEEFSKSIFDNQSILREIVISGVVCSTAVLSEDVSSGMPRSTSHNQDKAKKIVIGDPTEGALLYMAEEMSVTIKSLRDQWHLVEESPFSSETKRMMVRVKKDRIEMIYSKGAPESILSICTHIHKNDGSIFKMTQKEREMIQSVLDSWAEKGLRVLAFSSKKTSAADTSLQDTKVAEGQSFLGMTALHDAPRPEVRDAIQKAKSAGITSVMITGDNAKTASAVGSFVGLMEEGKTVLTGNEIDNLTDEQLSKKIPDVRVFARTMPFHKSRLVKLYQKQGEIVAATGDGVNDSIALKQADVGVAMGIVGTDVTRESADMVLTDDNFATIVNAVEEGRDIIKKLRNVIKYLLSTNAIEVLIITIGLIIGYSHILNPLQLLFINLITDGVPTLALAFSPRANHLMRKSPSKNFTLLRTIDYEYIFFRVFIGIFLSTGAFFLFRDQGIEVQRTVLFTVLVLIQPFMFIDLWLSHRSLFTHARLLVKPLFFLAVVFAPVIQYIVIRVPFFHAPLDITGISLQTYIICIGIAGLSIVSVETIKLIRGKVWMTGD